MKQTNNIAFPWWHGAAVSVFVLSGVSLGWCGMQRCRFLLECWGVTNVHCWERKRLYSGNPRQCCIHSCSSWMSKTNYLLIFSLTTWASSKIMVFKLFKEPDPSSGEKPDVLNRWSRSLGCGGGRDVPRSWLSFSFLLLEEPLCETLALWGTVGNYSASKKCDLIYFDAYWQDHGTNLSLKKKKKTSSGINDTGAGASI